MKRIIVLVLVLSVLMSLSVPSFAAVSGWLNQKMATRSGPGTKYSEELGVLSQDTEIVIINCVTTNGTPWCLVEFRHNGKLTRCYTGLKRINTEYNAADLPQGAVDYTEDNLTKNTKVYYGPGNNYNERKGSLSKGEKLRVFEVEGDWALVEYKRSAWERGYVQVECLKKTTAKATPAPVEKPASTSAGVRINNILDRSQHLCVDYYGNIYDYGYRDDEFVYMVGKLPVMSYFDQVPCIRSNTYVYSGPGEHYWRKFNTDGSRYAATGKLDTNLRIYGKERGWIMIRYTSDANGGYRYGWVIPQAISEANRAKTPNIEFVHEPAETTRACQMTDDPDSSLQKGGWARSASVQLIALAFLNEERDWVYCEFYFEDGDIARGFFPTDCIKLK